MLTATEIESALPPHLRTAVTPQFVDKVNNIIVDPLEAEEFQKNFITYNKVLTEGKYKTDDYLNAVAYVTYKLLGYSNKDAYTKTFPDRVRKMVAMGYDEKRQSAAISNYHKGQLVMGILQQSVVPAFVLHQGKVHQAIGVLAEVMEDPAALNKDRVAAADALLKHLTPPEQKEVNINLGVNPNSGMEELKAQIQDLAIAQRQAIQSGVVSVRGVAEMPLIEGTAKEVN